MPTAIEMPTTPMNAARNPTSCQLRYSCDNSTDMATIGPSSPNVPIAATSRPNGETKCPPSRRMGISTPRPVVDTAIVTINGA